MRKAYYKGSVDHHAKPETTARNWSAGMAVYDLSKPEDPKQIGFLAGRGNGFCIACGISAGAGAYALGAARRVLRLHPHHHRPG